MSRPESRIRTVCPECGYEVDDSSGIGDAKDARPEEGNVGICIRCAGVAFYVEQEDGTLGLRAATDEEQEELRTSEEITRVRAIILAKSVWMKP